MKKNMRKFGVPLSGGLLETIDRFMNLTNKSLLLFNSLMLFTITKRKILINFFK